MKNIGNTEDDPFDLTVTNDLIVGSSITTPIINFGPYPFTYSRGEWTPRSTTLRIIGLGPGCTLTNWQGQYNEIGNGSYTKVGDLVTLYFSTSVFFNGANNAGGTYRTPVIYNLPFRCKDTVLASETTMSGIISEASFPNGLIAGTPVPLAVTLDGNYTCTALEAGATFISSTPPLYIDPIEYVTDGTILFIACAQSQYAPPASWAGLEGNVYNSNVLAPVNGYEAAFKGSITYFTDE